MRVDLHHGQRSRRTITDGHPQNGRCAACWRSGRPRQSEDELFELEPSRGVRGPHIESLHQCEIPRHGTKRSLRYRPT